MDVCILICFGGEQMLIVFSELERQTAVSTQYLALTLVNVVCMREYVDNELTN